MTIFLSDMKQLERQVRISCLLGFLCNFHLSLSALSNSSCQQQGEYNIIKLNGNLQWKASRMFRKTLRKLFQLDHMGSCFLCDVRPSGPTATGGTGWFFQARLKSTVPALVSWKIALGQRGKIPVDWKTDDLSLSQAVGSVSDHPTGNYTALLSQTPKQSMGTCIMRSYRRHKRGGEVLGTLQGCGKIW